jgi:hypothetical protein
LSSNDLSKEEARLFKAVADRAKIMVGTVNDTYLERIQTKADYLGEKFKVESYTQKLFAEELLRASLFFSLSMCLKKLESVVRQKAQLGDWTVIS